MSADALRFPEVQGHTEARSEKTVPSTLPRAQQRIGGPSSGGNFNDESLLVAAASGSKDSIGELFRRYRRPVMNIARRILRDNSEAEDLCQEVFVYLFQNAKAFDQSKGSASSWIIQIAYSRALNRRRYLIHRQHYSAREPEEWQPAERSQQLELVDQVTARSLLSQLRKHLSDEQRETLELYFFEGYSLPEVAKKTNQKIGNVRHHFYRGLERLRSSLFPPKRPE